MTPKIPKASLDAIVDIVEERFPNELPRGETTLEHIHIKIGQQQVVRFLRELAEIVNG